MKIFYIENENILFSNLARDGLHIDESSLPKFCRTLRYY